MSEPQIDYRPEEHYVGIRTQTPMKGMFKVVDTLRNIVGGAGRGACRCTVLALSHHRHGLTGNKALLDYVKDNNLVMDRWDEAYLTDPKVEHRKSKWEIELAIKLADE